MNQHPGPYDLTPFVDAVGRLESSMSKRITEETGKLNLKLDDMRADFHKQSLERAASIERFHLALLDIDKLKLAVASLEDSRTKWRTIFLTVHGVIGGAFALWLSLKEFFKVKGP